MQSVMNLKIKYRESFRPFAPSVLARARRRLLRASTATAPTCCWWRRCARSGASPMTRGAAEPVGHRPAQRAALGHPGGHPRRLLGADPDRARGDQPALPRAAQRPSRRRPAARVIVNTSFNVRGEPIVVHARRRLPLLHAHRDGLARPRELRPREGAAEAAGRRHRLAQRVRAGLRGIRRNDMAHDRRLAAAAEASGSWSAASSARSGSGPWCGGTRARACGR